MRHNLNTLFTQVYNLRQSDVEAFDEINIDFTAWKPMRENTLQAIADIKVKVKEMGSQNYGSKSLWCTIGSGVLAGLSGIAAVAFPPSLIFTGPALVGAFGALGCSIAALSMTLVQLKFTEHRAKEIATIIQTDKEKTQSLYQLLDESVRVILGMEYTNLLYIGICVHDTGKVFDKFIEMIVDSSPSDLSNYLIKLDKDLSKDLELVENLCVYFALYKMYVSVNGN